MARPLRAIRPLPAAFDATYVKRLGHQRHDADLQAGDARPDPGRHRCLPDEHLCERMVMIWCGSTEIYMGPSPAHADLEAFEAAINAEDPAIAPSMLYACTRHSRRDPVANGAPNLAVDTPALRTFAEAQGVPISGKDFKTGQTLLKTVLAPMLEGQDARPERLVLHQHPGQPGRRGAGRPRELQDQGAVEARCAGGRPRAQALPRALRRRVPQGTDQLLPPAATTRRAGTTSTCSVGSATPCR